MLKIFLPLIAFSLYAATAYAEPNNQYQLSTHILDINAGKPANGITIKLFKYDDQTSQWKMIEEGITDKNGRIANFLPKQKNNEGTYKLSFETMNYFSSQNMQSIYPFIDVVFKIEGASHYHIPITMSANGYATYRGN